MNSVWVESAARPSFPELRESKRCDVLIIGGGIAGILCAYKLKGAGVDCMLVEADRLCGGITKNTTAKITLQHGLIFDRLIKGAGWDKARLYLEAQAEACREYERLSESIECDYERTDLYVYSRSDQRAIEREAKALDSLGVGAELCDKVGLPLETVGAVRVRGQAQLHPLKLLFGLAGELPVYERTKVLELMPHKAITERAEIAFEKAVIATHFPVLNKHGGYFLKMYQHRSYVLALEGASKPDGMYVDELDTGLSFRGFQNLLLLGGGAHRTGKRGGGFRELEEFARANYPEARVVTRWATQDCMTLDGIPYIGKYAKSAPELYVATGFNKWGMTSAMVSATLLCDLICGKDNAYARVFSPSRSILHPQLAVNAFETLISLLIPTAPRCPHLGCALKYNREEHSWDCPCHGSRFSEDGELIDNPATDDKRNIKGRRKQRF